MHTFAIKDSNGTVIVDFKTHFSQRATDFVLGSFNVQGKSMQELWQVILPSFTLTTITTRLELLRKVFVQAKYNFESGTNYYWLHVGRDADTWRAVLEDGDSRIIADETTSAEFHGTKQKLELSFKRGKYFEKLTTTTRTFTGISGFGGKFTVLAADMGADGARIKNIICDIASLDSNYRLIALTVGMLDDSSLDTGFLPQQLLTGTTDWGAIGGACHQQNVDAANDEINSVIFNNILSSNNSHMIGDYYQYVRWKTNWANTVNVTMRGGKDNIAFTEQVDISENTTPRWLVNMLGRRQMPHTKSMQVDGSTLANASTLLSWDVASDNLVIGDYVRINGFAFIPAKKALRAYEPNEFQDSNNMGVGFYWHPNYEISVGRAVTDVANENIIRFTTVYSVQGQDLDLTMLGGRFVLLGECVHTDGTHETPDMTFDVTVTFYPRSLFAI